jgi:hypothetical protein
MSGIDEHISEREEIEMLLPWYVTGKLDAADTARVESFLAQHPDMLSQLAVIAEEQTVTVEDNEAIRPRLASAGAIVARTQAPGSAVRAWWDGMVESVKELFRTPTPGAVRWAAAAAAVIICLQTAALGTLLMQDTGGYQIASRPGIGGEHAPVALIAFTDRASMADIARVLAENRLRVVDGPLPGGFFSVSFEDNATGDEQKKRFDAILARKDLIRAVITGR